MEDKLNSNQELINLIDSTTDFFWNQRGTAPFSSNVIGQCEELLEKAKLINYRLGIGRCLLSLGMGAFIVQHNSTKSLNFLNEAHLIFKELDDKKWVANSFLTIAIITNSTGKPEIALYPALKGIEYYSNDCKDPSDIVMANYVIGTIYKDLKNHPEAEKYYITGIEKSIKDDSWLGRIYTGLSNIYNDRGEYNKALELAIKSLDLLRKEQNQIGESRALTDIGIIYKKLKNYDYALNYLFQGLKIRSESSFKNFLLGSLLEISVVYTKKNEFENAIKYLLEALPVAIETNHQPRIVDIYRELASLYKTTNNYLESLKHYEKYIEHTLAQNLKERDIKINDLQSTLVHEKEEEIERLKNVELKNAHKLISEKNKEIIDSINYAKRIQTALITSEMYIEKALNKLNRS